MAFLSSPGNPATPRSQDVSIIALLFAMACSPALPEAGEPEAGGPSVAGTPRPTEAEEARSDATEVEMPPPKKPAPSSTDAQELFPAGIFPPPDPGVPYERSKHEGDGVFRLVFEAAPDLPVEKRTEGEPGPTFGEALALRLVIHPHEASRFIKLTVAAFDLRQLSLAHVPGAQDVLDVDHPELSQVAGLVPEEKRGSLFAIFNEGFQPKHGRWGMLSLGVQLVPPREDGCTFAVLSDGTARVGSWPRLKEDERIVAYRQTPPCLVEEGEVHPKLLRGDRKPWAGQQKDLKTRRRSAVGVSKDGRTLFYALGTEAEPEELAAGMKHVGAHSAAQLDINWNWTRLFFFGEKDGEVRPLGALEEHMAKDKGEYIDRPGKRGFFYLVRR